MAGGVLGRCTLPSELHAPAPAGPSADRVRRVQRDGVDDAPGGEPGYDRGMTAVHETGHWLGLLHTLGGTSCDGLGDYIADTSPQAVSTSQCLRDPAKDSCPGQSGVDPIHNFMGYSTDECYEEFTPMQEQRVKEMWMLYRARHVN